MRKGYSGLGAWRVITEETSYADSTAARAANDGAKARPHVTELVSVRGGNWWQLVATGGNCNIPHQIAPAALVRLCPFGHLSMLEGESATSIMKEIEQYVEGGNHE